MKVKCIIIVDIMMVLYIFWVVFLGCGVLVIDRKGLIC